MPEVMRLFFAERQGFQEIILFWNKAKRNTLYNDKTYLNVSRAWRRVCETGKRRNEMIDQPCKSQNTDVVTVPD